MKVATLKQTIKKSVSFTVKETDQKTSLDSYFMRDLSLVFNLILFKGL